MFENLRNELSKKRISNKGSEIFKIRLTQSPIMTNSKRTERHAQCTGKKKTHGAVLPCVESVLASVNGQPYTFEDFLQEIVR